MIERSIDLKSLGARLKQRRLELGLTQMRLGKMVGVSHVTISLWESGDVNPKNIHRLAEALRTNVPWLEEGVGNPDAIGGVSDAQAAVTILRDKASITLLPILRTDEEVREWLSGRQQPDQAGALGLTATHIEVGDRAFAYLVDDEAMRGRLEPFDLVVLDPGKDPRPGDVVGMLSKSGEFLVRLFQLRSMKDPNDFSLAPANPAYPSADADMMTGRAGVMVERRCYRR